MAVHSAHSREPSSYTVLLARTPTNRNESGLDGGDGATRATIVALHEVQPVGLLQSCLWRFARRARDVLSDVATNDLLDRFGRKTALDHHARRRIDRAGRAHLREHESVYLPHQMEMRGVDGGVGPGAGGWWLVVVGCWLLVVGCWLLIVCCVLLGG